MVLLSLPELLPASIAGLGVAGTLASAGLGAAVIWAAVLVIPHARLLEERGETHGTSGTTSASLVVCGLVLHDVPEGFAMASKADRGRHRGRGRISEASATPGRARGARRSRYMREADRFRRAA
jgi:hypothetical protein